MLQKRWSYLFLAWCTVFTLFPLAAMAEENEQVGKVPLELMLEAKSAILLDVSTGQILYQSNADIAYPPASMSKMMTEFIVMEEIKSGRLSWEDTVVVSQNAQDTVGSKVFLAAGDIHTVKELFIAMAVGSANDATVALAEQIAGTEEAFAIRMNETAKKLQLDKAHFINATGLGRVDMKEGPQSIEGETVMSARDAALLALAIQREHPDFLDISSLSSYQFRERDEKPIINYNWMLEGNKEVPALKSFAYEGLDGMKTGFTDEAGYCFTGTAEREGTRLISVVMGTASESQRFTETKKLLDYGFGRFESKMVLPAKSKLKGFETAKVYKGKQKTIDIVTNTDMRFMVAKGEELQLEIQAEIVDKSQLVAPIKQGTVLGTATITYSLNGQPYIRTVDLIANEDVEKSGWFRLLLQAIGNFFSSLFKSIVGLFS
ncbi:D-alanyl-D-alanine carboxypeptidase [Cohnella sp. CIP 111063]|nr:D-alanyl-D-alanine carboxypeptidase [Cohnella sp. CIP 111063]